MKSLTTIIVMLVFQLVSMAAERPNILWITSEDNDYGWLGCYGNKEAKTPHLDALPAKGVLFKYAYSNAPVCAVARSTILNGAYAPSQGTQHMRSRHEPSEKFKPYPAYLRELGYYCTNRSKTDYNFKGNDASYWDECSGKAHYKNRPKGAPFFAIFNLTVSHESSLFENRIAQNRKRGLIPQQPNRSPDKVQLRPYLPDLSEIRRDVAIYHDVITAMDRQVGQILADLEKAGLAENTIVFYYSDHGGVTPRGKRYLKDSGVRVPMLVHVPEKWQHLSPFKAGEKSTELVSFVDLAPTLLSLAGHEMPFQMQGRAFLGKQRVDPAKDEVEFLYADRFDEFYGMRRGITDGRWKYIRRFTPHLPAAPYSYYQFQQAGWSAWKEAWEKGSLAKNHQKIWLPNQAVEELYDTDADPWEVNNLAKDPAHSEKLETMRGRLKATMIDTKDTGVIPEAMFAEISPDKPIADYFTPGSLAHREAVNLAFAATDSNAKNLIHLESQLKSPDPLIRYWALQGLLLIDIKDEATKSKIREMLNDKISANRIVASHILFKLGEEKSAMQALLKELNSNIDEYAKLSAINVIVQCNATDQIKATWIHSVTQDKKAGKYLKRFAEQLLK